jgi:hypothetical protein
VVVGVGVSQMVILMVVAVLEVVIVPIQDLLLLLELRIP